jgi:hypothetical protein
VDVRPNWKEASPVQEDVDGAVVFRQACVMGLEGIVAEQHDSRYPLGTLPRMDQDQEPGAFGDRAGNADCVEQASAAMSTASRRLSICRL